MFLALKMTSSFSRHTRPRGVHEDPAHHLRGNGKEMRPILPVGPADTDEAQERFVDQSPAFEGVAVPFVSHVPARSTTEVIIDVRNQLSQSAGVPGAPCPQQTRYLSCSARRHPCPPKFFSALL